MKVEELKSVPVLGEKFSDANSVPYFAKAEVTIRSKCCPAYVTGNIPDMYKKELFMLYVKGIVLHHGTPYLCYSRVIKPDSSVQGVSVARLEDLIAYKTLEQL